MQIEDSFIESNRNGRAIYGEKGVCCSIGSQSGSTTEQWLISSAFIGFVINASGPINSERAAKHIRTTLEPKWLPQSVRDTANGELSFFAFLSTPINLVSGRNCSTEQTVYKHRQHLIMTA